MCTEEHRIQRARDSLTHWLTEALAGWVHPLAIVASSSSAGEVPFSRPLFSLHYRQNYSPRPFCAALPGCTENKGIVVPRFGSWRDLWVDGREYLRIKWNDTTRWADGWDALTRQGRILGKCWMEEGRKSSWIEGGDEDEKMERNWRFTNKTNPHTMDGMDEKQLSQPAIRPSIYATSSGAGPEQDCLLAWSRYFVLCTDDVVCADYCLRIDTAAVAVVDFVGSNTSLCCCCCSWWALPGRRRQMKDSSIKDSFQVNRKTNLCVFCAGKWRPPIGSPSTLKGE